jgi:hypothetical protein
MGTAYGKKRNAYWILMSEPEGKRPLVDNIKMDLRETGRGGMDWNDLAQDKDWWRALMKTVMNLWIP